MDVMRTYKIGRSIVDIFETNSATEVSTLPEEKINVLERLAFGRVKQAVIIWNNGLIGARALLLLGFGLSPIRTYNHIYQKMEHNY